MPYSTLIILLIAEGSRRTPDGGSVRSPRLFSVLYRRKQQKPTKTAGIDENSTNQRTQQVDENIKNRRKRQESTKTSRTDDTSRNRRKQQEPTKTVGTDESNKNRQQKQEPSKKQHKPTKKIPGTGEKGSHLTRRKEPCGPVLRPVLATKRQLMLA